MALTLQRKSCGSQESVFCYAKLPSRLLGPGQRKRIQFLYLTVIEPILLYGCSLWAPLLNSKAGIKKARSCQRAFLTTAIGAFKTVSTETLLLLNAAIPIELRVAQITSTRFRTCTNEFSPASLKWLMKFFPCIIT
jgi:hypothetical protein